MKIVSSALQMAAQHSEQRNTQITSSLRAWIVDRSPAAAAEAEQAQALASSPVQISEAGKAAQSDEISAIQKSIDDAENDPTLRLIRTLVALLTGKDITEVNSGARHRQTSSGADPLAPSPPVAPPQAPPTLPPAQAAGFGIEYARHETYSESEQTRFTASGVVNTADGQQIDFSLTLSMARSYHEEANVSIRFGDARQTQDPLVLNFDGNAAQLTDRRFAFDLNADGAPESINFVAGGSGFLALDRNADGRINDGGELFGVKSGNGFADLATLDSDQNGWIDENDAAYNDLRIWTKDASGADLLSTLRQADVGAIALAYAATPFAIKDANNEQQGQIRSSGIFLHEQGNVGTIQQVDLTI